MIRIDRSRVPEPAVLGRKTEGRSETERAIEHYTVGWDGTSTFSFRRYKEDEVKAQLARLFLGKCAYCESRFAHVSPEDIEHWRPKGSVQQKDGSEKKPGYYWLAATWSNLLPSCVDCNRRRRQLDARNPDHLQSGKESQFPVADEGQRWTRPDQADRNGEQPLLLDPTSPDPADEPSLFLAVAHEGKAVMEEKPPAGTLANARAHATIEVFGLNRSNLVDERTKERLRLEQLIREATKLAQRLDRRSGTTDPEVAEMLAEDRETLVEKLAQIKLERQPESPYLLMKLPLIDGFMATQGRRLTRLGVI